MNFKFEISNLKCGFLCAALIFLSAACGAKRDVDPSKPRAGPPYPVQLAPSEDRSRATLDAWSRLLADQGITNATAPALQPTTGTLQALPSGVTLRLPQVGGEGREMTDEETRESLRRFLASVVSVIGAQPSELSLVTYEKAGAGQTRAVYQQTPFELPLRGDFGRVEVVFTPDRRVVSLSSTAIPEVERLRRAFASVPQQNRLTAERAAASISGRALTYTGASGNTHTRNVAAEGETSVRELVIYPQPSKTDPAMLELYLAWEIAVGGAGQQLLVYVDAVSGNQLAVAPAPQS